MYNETITIPFEEYKELLIIKGKYEELKELYIPKIYPTQITYNGEITKDLKPPYTITCGTYNPMKDDKGLEC